MTDDEREYQAEKMVEFIRRGGNKRVWMRSKGFRKAERYAIEQAAAGAERGASLKILLDKA